MQGQAIHYLEFAAKVRDVMKRFAAARIPLPASNRLDTLAKQFERWGSVPGDVAHIPPAELAAFHYGMVESHQLSLIAQYLDLKNRRWREKLVEIVSGPFDIRLEKDSLPRNTQSELYFAARFAQAGFRVEPPDAPNRPVDFDVRVEQAWFGVEVKRISSKRKIDQRLREGMKQVRDSRRPGLIALDLSPLIVVTRSPQRFESDQQMEASYMAHLRRMLDPRVKQIRERQEFPGCAALLWAAHYAYYHIGSNVLCAAVGNNAYPLVPWTDPRLSLVQRMQHRFVVCDEQEIPGAMRLNSPSDDPSGSF